MEKITIKQKSPNRASANHARNNNAPSPLSINLKNDEIMGALYFVWIKKSTVAILLLMMYNFEFINIL